MARLIKKNSEKDLISKEDCACGIRLLSLSGSLSFMGA